MSDQLFEAPTSYPADFEAARAAYRPVKNDSKSDAFKAWNQTAKIHLAGGAFGERLLACCRLYNQWLAAENVKRLRARQSEHPKMHMATFLRQRRYENFLSDAEQVAAKAASEAAQHAVLTKGWEKEAETLVAELTGDRFIAWFDGVQVNRHGATTELIFPKPFKASYVAQYFPYALRRAFGSCTLSALGSPRRYDL